MKKAFLLIPIAIMSCLLGACGKKEAAPIYLNSWLIGLEGPESNPNGPSFYIPDDKGNFTNSSYDYDLKLRDELISLTKGITPVKINKNTTNDVGAKYKISRHYDRFNGCSINIRENGTIETFASGSGWGAPKEQMFSYQLTESVTKNLIEIFHNRYQEIIYIKQEEKKAAKEASTPEKLFEAIEQSETEAYISYRETRPVEETTNRFTIQDENQSYLNDFKDLEYSELSNYSIDYESMVSYYLTDEWMLNIYAGYEQANYNIASIKYLNKNPTFKSYYQTYYYFYYEINATKGRALAERIRAAKPID